MSSTNPHFTFHYSQPDEYRFSHDSVFLARHVFEHLRDVNLTDFSCLDLCAGSGIIGMDFLFHRRQAQQSLPAVFDFLEIQEVYRLHFEENARRLNMPQTQLHFVQANYDNLQRPEYHKKYDLIVVNPPYFLVGQGKLSSSNFKNRCRFFIDSDLRNLLTGIAVSLKDSGVCYALMRDLPDHKVNILEEAQKICTGRLRMDVVGDIRGTHFLRISRLPTGAV